MPPKHDDDNLSTRFLFKVFVMLIVTGASTGLIALAVRARYAGRATIKWNNIEVFLEGQPYDNLNSPNSPDSPNRMSGNLDELSKPVKYD